MGKFDGMKLLELGTNVGSVDIVNYARSEGAYVIVADYLPIEKSAAKQVADEAVDISTTDIPALVEFAKTKKIDGVFSGVSESNILSAKKVADALSLPSYFTLDQWNLMQNKAEFKKLCIENGVTVPKEYTIKDIKDEKKLAEIDYPVIVKPVDSSSSIGIHICHSVSELQNGYIDAISKSPSKQAIVEQFIIGTEISIHYTFINGDCCLSLMADKYTCKKDMGFTPLPEVVSFPSKYQDVFLKTLDKSIKKMFLSTGYKNGVAFIQGIANEKGIYIFECGLRISGGAFYRFIDHINGNNFMKMLVEYSLLGKIDASLKNEDCKLKGKHGCIISFLNRGGKIKSIFGYEEAKNLPCVIGSELRYQVGDTITKMGTLKQYHIRIFVVCDSLEELCENILKIKSMISVRDENDEEMIYSDFDIGRIYKTSV